MRHSKLLCSLAFSLPMLAQQAFLAGPQVHYWDNSATGSNANDGLDSTKPLQTIAAMNAKPIPVGTTFHLAKDSAWREEFTSAQRNLTFVQYGAGTNLPLIDGSDVLLNASFTKTGGLTNVYQIAVTIPSGSTVDCINALESGAFLTYRASTALVDANAGSYTVDSCAAGARTLYIRATTGIPTTNGLLYEYTARNESIHALVPSGTLRASGWTVNGVWTRRNADASGSIGLGRRGRVLNSLVDQGNRHSLICADGCDVEGSTVQYCVDYNQACILGVVNEDLPIGLGITVKNSTFHTSSGSAFISHPDSGGNFGVATVDTITEDGSGSGISWGNVASQTFNAVTGLTPSLSGGASSSTITASNISGAAIPIGSASQSVTIDGTTIVSPTSAVSVTVAGVNLTFTNNNATVGSAQAQILTNASATTFSLTRTGNTFAASSGSYLRDSLQADSTIVNSNFNTWNGTMSGTSYYVYTYNTGFEFNSTPQKNYTYSARWNLGSAYVVGLTIPDIDGQGLNLNFPGGGHDPTSQTAGCLFGSTLYLAGPTLVPFKALTPSGQITVVARWTGTPGGLSTTAYMTRVNNGGALQGGTTASKARGFMGAFNENSPVSTTSIDDGNWHAITVLSNGATNPPIHIWVDGSDQGTPGTLTGQLTNSTGLVYVGGDNGGTTGNWTGVIGYVEYGAGFMSAPAYATYYAGLKSSLAAQGITLP